MEKIEEIREGWRSRGRRSVSRRKEWTSRVRRLLGSDQLPGRIFTVSRDYSFNTFFKTVFRKLKVKKNREHNKYGRLLYFSSLL